MFFGLGDVIFVVTIDGPWPTTRAKKNVVIIIFLVFIFDVIKFTNNKQQCLHRGIDTIRTGTTGNYNIVNTIYNMCRYRTQLLCVTIKLHCDQIELSFSQ